MWLGSAAIGKETIANRKEADPASRVWTRFERMVSKFHICPRLETGYARHECSLYRGHRYERCKATSQRPQPYLRFPCEESMHAVTTCRWVLDPDSGKATVERSIQSPFQSWHKLEAWTLFGQGLERSPEWRDVPPVQ